MPMQPRVFVPTGHWLATLKALFQRRQELFSILCRTERNANGLLVNIVWQADSERTGRCKGKSFAACCYEVLCRPVVR